MSDDGSSEAQPVELTTKGRIMDGECVRVRLQQVCVCLHLWSTLGYTREDTFLSY